MSHPLDDAFDRVRRGERHFSDLKRRIRTAEAKLTLVRFNRKGDRVAAVLKPLKPFGRPSTLSIIIGECIYNLRAALDYLIFELARLDSGRTQEKTQFPIESCEKFFRQHKDPRTGCGRSKLVGVNKSHVAMIEGLQPFKGVKWTGRLATLSNSDKHRLLTILYARARQKTLLTFTNDSSFPPNRYADRAAPKGVHVQRPALRVQFDDGSLILNRLHEIKTGVAETLQAFKPEFK